jgi:hypothetical protein
VLSINPRRSKQPVSLNCEQHIANHPVGDSASATARRRHAPGCS